MCIRDRHGKDASQRVELRERIITAATEAFTSKGIKSITMDDIAAALGTVSYTHLDPSIHFNEKF